MLFGHKIVNELNLLLGFDNSGFEHLKSSEEISYDKWGGLLVDYLELRCDCVKGSGYVVWNV